MAAKRMKPVLYGAAYSVYVRIVRLALMEKGVGHDLVEVDIFAEGGPPADHSDRHPFGRIPAFRHGDLRIYETGAIARYVDEGFPGPALQPVDAAARARMNQVVSVLDNYLYRPLVWGVYVPRSEVASACDEVAIGVAAAKARHCLGIVEAGMTGDWLAGDRLTLADLYAAPMIAYGLLTVEGREMLAGLPRLAAWWQRVNSRPAMAASRFSQEIV